MSKGAYTPELTPVARPDDVVRLDDGDEQRHFRIEQMAVLPHIENDGITVADGQQERNVELNNLEVWNGWLAQYRMPRLPEELPDGVEIQADLGGSQAPIWQNLNERGAIDNDTALRTISGGPQDDSVELESIAHMLELFVYEQEVPKFSVTNTSGSSQTVSVSFTGWAFNVSEVPESQVSSQPVYVPVESIRGD